MDDDRVPSSGSAPPRASTRQQLEASTRQLTLKSHVNQSEDDFVRITGEAGDVEECPDAHGALALTFEDVRFSVQVAKERPAGLCQGSHHETKVILEPVSGHFEPGTLVAVMGPSGSGKTTLLDILAGKKAAAGVGGVVKVNGRPRPKMFQRISTYVAQDDILPAHVTVQEAVMFHMQLKQERPSNRTRQMFQESVIKSLIELGLVGVKDMYIGSQSVRGISGGQRRRTSLACGFTGTPQIMFCDEPTSGLSATDAETVVKYMRLIAHKYRITIMVVIHQPRLEVARLFDHLLLLATRPGRCVFNGPMKELPSFLAEVARPVPKHANPADVVMDLVTPGSSKSCPEVLLSHFEATRKPAIGQQVELQMGNERKSCRELLEDLHDRLSEFGTMPKVRDSRYGVRFRTQLAVVGMRQLKLYLRESRGIVADLMIAVAKGTILGLTYVHIGTDGAMKQLAFFFMLMMSVGIDGMKGIPKLIADRKVMKMETSEALYSEWAYIIPFTLISWFQALMSNTIFMVMIFSISNLPWPLFPDIWLWSTLLRLTLDSVFLMLSAVAKDTSMAYVMALPFFMLFLLFNGFSVNRVSAPPFVGWIVNISPVAYAIEEATMAAVNHYGTHEYKLIAKFFGYVDQPGTAITVMVAVATVFRLLQVLGLKFLNNIQR